jgi:hypothetical protein
MCVCVCVCVCLLVRHEIVHTIGKHSNGIVLGPHKLNWRVSFALFLALKQNFIANRCSILKSTTRLSHTASFHATNHKYCSTHSDNTKHTTCRDLLLCVSVGDRLMMRVVFAPHNQSQNLVDGLCISFNGMLVGQVLPFLQSAMSVISCRYKWRR